MNGTDDMMANATTSPGSVRSNRRNTEIPLTVSALIEKSADFLSTETISISRSSSISTNGTGSTNGSGGKNGGVILKTNHQRKQNSHAQSTSNDSPKKDKKPNSNNNNINMSPVELAISLRGSDNGQGLPLAATAIDIREEIAPHTSDARKISGGIEFEDTTLSLKPVVAVAETEGESSMADTYFTPSTSIQNLSSQVTSMTSGIGSESDLSGSINSGDSMSMSMMMLDDGENGENLNNRGFDTSPVSPDNLNGSRPSLDMSTNDLTNSVISELTVSLDSSTTSKESSCSSSHSNSKEALQPGIYNQTMLPTKKKMWYNVFQPSYKSRSGDFKKYFKELPPEERLISDYSCALQRDILVQGRMYVSQSYISFYANIFGWETQTCIRYKDVAAITKEKTALVIPNAIQICTETEKFFFASFVGRDATFMLLFKLWQRALLEDTMPMKQVWQFVRSCYGEIGDEEEEEAEDEDYLPLGSRGGVIPSILLSGSNTNTDTDNDKDNKSIGIDEVSENGHLLPSDHLPLSTTSTLKAVNGLGLGVADTDSSDSEGEILHVPVDDAYLEVPTCPVSHAQGVELVNAIIPCDVDQLFTMLFTKSKFYWDFHTKRKTFNIIQGDWEQNIGETKKVRQVSFTVTLNNAMGPKHSQVTETQVLLPESKPGCLYVIDAESVNAGIPYEDSFYVTCHFCLTRVSAQESKLIIVSQVKYKKSVSWMIKPFIEKNSWAGLREFYSHLERAVKEECANVAVLAHSPAPSIRSSEILVRRRKRMAPAPPGASPVNVPVKENIPLIPTLGENEPITSQIVAKSSLVFTFTLAILAALVLLNGYLFVKLNRLEVAPNSMPQFQLPTLSTDQLPQNHQEWLTLLQRQEALHRMELQKWQEVLIAALQILHQAEGDLKVLSSRITTYTEGKLNMIGLGMKPNPESKGLGGQMDVPIPHEEEKSENKGT